MKPKKEYQLIIGRHLSLAKTEIDEIPLRIESLEMNAVMIFLTREEKTNDYSKVERFKKLLEEKMLKKENFFLHISYLMNLANTEKKGLYKWSLDKLKKEISRGEKLGIEKIIIHPGSAKGKNEEECLNQLAAGLEETLNQFPNIKIALETMCKKGNLLGWNFSQIKKIIEKIKNNQRLGVCLDTCHVYSSGYDIKNKLAEVIKEFEKEIGLEKLFVIHLNDSKGKLGSNLDKHANIGEGEIGEKILKEIVWHEKFDGIAKILETPDRGDKLTKKELKKLKSS